MDLMTLSMAKQYTDSKLGDQTENCFSFNLIFSGSELASGQNELTTTNYNDLKEKLKNNISVTCNIVHRKRVTTGGDVYDDVYKAIPALVGTDKIVFSAVSYVDSMLPGGSGSLKIYRVTINSNEATVAYFDIISKAM